MATKIRKSPPVCLGISIFRLLTGRVRYSKNHIGTSVKMEDGQKFEIFRHIAQSVGDNKQAVVFIVSFKFARLTHKANKIASIIPMLLITGFPGFQKKIYAVNPNNGYWQGMYQWESKKHLEEYKKSFVFKVMNKRAINGSINSMELNNDLLNNFIENNKL